MSIPFWKSLPVSIKRQQQQKSKEESQQDLPLSFGNREGHCSCILSSQMLICFGGWTDGEGTKEIIGLDLLSSSIKQQQQWQVLVENSRQ